jgi:hypothetical protein
MDVPEDLLHCSSARVFGGLAARYGEAFVRKRYKRVQRGPYEKRTGETLPNLEKLEFERFTNGGPRPGADRRKGEYAFDC